MALSGDFEVSRAMIESIPLIIPFLHQSKVNNEIIGITISLILEKASEDITQLALGLIGQISRSIGSELIEKYFYREIYEIAHNSSVNTGKVLIELVSNLFVLPHSESLRAKLIGIFVKFMESDNWNLRKQCISFFPRVFKNCNKDMQDLLLPLFCKTLKDKSKWVKEQAINTCCCVIIYSKINISEAVVKSFLKISDSGHYHAAFYFPGVLLALGPSVWGELKKLYLKLADSDLRTKSCLIKSFHEVARILGAEIAGKDLAELYNQFLIDEDVKSLAYETLPSFLREIFPEDRDKYKFSVKSLARDKDWRKRDSLGRNLCEYIGVFDYNHIYTEIWPLALELCEDSISTVRLNAAKETAKLACYLLSKNSDWKRHIELSIKKYATGNWNSKIVFLNIVKNFASSEFAQDFTDEVVALAQDSVKNVRIMCAEAVNSCKSLESVWKAARKLLEDDTDEDVRFEFGKTLRCGGEKGFVAPPIFRKMHSLDVGGIVKFSHSAPPKFAKIEDFEDISGLIKGVNKAF